MLRGSPKRTVLPVSSSMLATVMVSVAGPSGRRRSRRRSAARCSGRASAALAVAVAEHRDDEVALHRRPGGRRRAGSRRRRSTAAVDADHREPLLLPQPQRLAEPPGVDEQAGPADGQRHQHDPQQASSGRVGGQRERQLPGASHRDEDGDHDGDERRPRSRSAIRPTALVARDQLGRPGQHQRHQHQRDRAAEADAGRRGRRWPRRGRPSSGPGGRCGRASSVPLSLGKWRGVGDRASITSHTRHSRHDAPERAGHRRRVAPRLGRRPLPAWP